MSIVNRRNAVVGWVVVKAGKYIVKKTAADAVPSPKTGAAAGGLAALAGALLVWRRRGGGSDE